MTVLIVIPTLNEAQHISDVLNLARSECDALRGQIVVADGGSTDATREIVARIAEEDPQVKLLDNPGRYQSAAVNRAVAAFGDGFDWLVRLDAHSAYPPDYCRTLVAEAQSTGAASVVVTMRAVGAAPLQRIIAAAQNSRFGNGASAHRNSTQGAWVDHGHHALISVDAFRAVGGYDPEFTHNEDAELDFRLVQEGYRIWLTNRTALTYFPRPTLGALMRQYRNFGRGRRRNLAKHNQRPAPRQAIVAALAPSLLLSLLGGVHPLFAVPLLLWLLGCGIAGVIIWSDTGRADTVLAGPVAGLMQLAWSTGYWQQVLGEHRPGGRRVRT